MSTDSHGPGEQPTAPIPRTGRNDDPTQIFETFGTRGEGEPRTEALPTGEPRTEALPTGEPRTEVLSTRQPATQALPAEPAATAAAAPAERSETHGRPTKRVSAFGADARTAWAAAPGAGDGGDHAGGTGGGATATPGGSAHPAAPPTTTTTAASTTTAERPVSRTLRVGTVVWGLIIAVIGAGLVSVAAGARFDVELVLIGLLALGGVALVAGSLAVGMRRRH
jgi:hypothetical protein